MTEKTIELSGHRIGAYCGADSIRHIVREICHGCGAKPGEACRLAAPTEVLMPDAGRKRKMNWRVWLSRVLRCFWR